MWIMLKALFQNNRHETELDLAPDPSHNKRWAIGAKPINVIIYVLFLIKPAQDIYAQTKKT